MKNMDDARNAVDASLKQFAARELRKVDKAMTLDRYGIINHEAANLVVAAFAERCGERENVQQLRKAR